MITRYFSVGRKIVLFSFLAGLLAAVLAGSLQYTVIHHKRTEQFDSIIKNLHNYLNTYFSELLTTIDYLQPLTMSPCNQIQQELTARAAFSVNVRAFLLVIDNRAVCSSATGPMNVPLDTLSTDVDAGKASDMQLLPGTPMMPSSPAFAIWVRNPLMKNHGVFASVNANLTPFLLYSAKQNNFSGIALVVNHRALTTFSSTLVDPDKLNVKPVRIAKIDNLPLQIYLYGTMWGVQDTQYAVLLMIVVGLLTGLLCFYILSIGHRPGKEILTAIKRNQFYVVYQPVVAASDMKIRGVEVLMRWKHPTAGEIPPDAFIHFAEAQNLIVPLTRHLFELIARDAAALQKILPPGAKLGINIAPGHLHTPSFQDDMRAFSATLPPNYFQVVLEITERDTLQQQAAMRVFEWLHHEGFEIAIDDFGTGHSALIYLERYAFDYLKIDRGFIKAIGTETVTSPVLDAVLTLAKRMDLVTVAEGVETQEQAEWLRDHGVNFLQGYWISRPITLARFLEAWNEPAKYFTTD
ncbi:cyclic di-GMP phosphodiesterase [Trabulsiella odontotermitis]|uniref:cyclic-guanylate-specific phosphodiesterase n=1 Tax=Trabulsiella odontotermitis TaxID=379893 RepID=A0A0L0GNC9_9ENTR|nr:cyclic di-GMP phosphodiesterase [Trabulsiella odontotermitis]KNC90266.1 phage resistance protein [Trabulsiella odontotermitis]